MIWGFGRALFDVGDHSDETRVAVQRLEVGVLIHAQRAGWRQPAVNGLSQKRQCLGAIPSERRDTQN